LHALEKSERFRETGEAECFRDRRVLGVVSEFDPFPFSQLLQQRRYRRSVQDVGTPEGKHPIAAAGSELDWSAAIDLYRNWRIDAWASRANQNSDLRGCLRCGARYA
jgi:hypothetical protein